MTTAPKGPVLVSRALQALMRLQSAPCLRILIFHRVLEAADPMLPGEVHAMRFDRLMAIVARSYTVLSLGDAARQLARGRLPEGALAITFDDGYADNATIALPILQRHGLVATFFVATGFLDGGLMWNDAVIECMRAAQAQSLDLGAFGLPRADLRTLEARRAAVGLLLPRLKHLAPAERSEAVARLHQLAGSPRMPMQMMMRSDQVQALAAAGMEIGAHTVNHPILNSISIAEAEHEIASGRDRLQALIGARVETLAYPNGRPGTDYARSHVELVRRLGFAAAVSTAPGVARRGDDLLQLPRFTPWDRSDARWAARLALAPARRPHAVVRAAPSELHRADVLLAPHETGVEGGSVERRSRLAAVEAVQPKASHAEIAAGADKFSA